MLKKTILKYIIIFLFFQTIISDENSDESICTNMQTNNCQSAIISTPNYLCCSLKFVMTMDRIEATNYTECIFISKDKYLESKNSLNNVKDKAFQREYFGLKYKEEIEESINLSCKDGTIIYENGLTEEDDKNLIKSKEHCWSFLYSNATKEDCKNKKVTETAKKAGFECAFFSIEDKNSGYIENHCSLLNSDIFTTKKLYNDTLKLFVLRETEYIKEIVTSNGKVLKPKGDKFELSSKNLKNNFILFFLLILSFL